jgi:arylsulfatase A-like enzyme
VLFLTRVNRFNHRSCLKRLDIPRLALFWGLLTGFGESALFYWRGSWSPIASDILRSSVVFEPLIFLALGLLALLAGKPSAGALMRFHFVVSWCALFAWFRLALPLQSPVRAALEVLPIAALAALFLTGAALAVSRKATWPLVVCAGLVAIIVPVRQQMHEQHQVLRLPSSAPGSPNVLLVVVDTLRADHLSTYGYSRPTSPFLSRIASEGVLFENAIAPSSWTLPSHASMLTGLYPHEHHAQTEGSYLVYSTRTVAEAFEQAGYRTGVFSANTSFFGRRVGFGRGFVHFEDDFECWAGMLGQTYWGGQTQAYTYHLAEVAHLVPPIHPLYREILGRRRAGDINHNFLHWAYGSGRPFFAVLNYFDTHDPYLPPEPFRHLYSKAKNPGWYSSLSWVEELTAAQRQDALDAYDGSINYVDARLQDLFTSLRDRGLDSNTVVVITSDHGESFDEHGLMDHGNTLYRELIRVPLLVWAPGRVPGGQRIAQPVSTLSLSASLLDLAGAQGTLRFRGPSLVALWKGTEAPGPSPVSELAQMKWNRRFPNSYGPMVSITTSEWHYISGGEYGIQLFRCCERDIEEMDLAQTVLGGPVVQRLSAEMAGEGARDPLPAAAPRQYRYATGDQPTAFAIADFNQDGNADIAIAQRGGRATVLLGDGKGWFSPSATGASPHIPFQQATLEARGDLDGNGLEDVALADPANHAVRFFFQHPNGRVTTSTLRLDAVPRFIALADVNHNGLADLLVASEDSSVTVLLSGAARVATARDSNGE